MAPQSLPAPDLTVADLIRLLSQHDSATPVRLAINPFHPMAHRLDSVTAGQDQDGRTTVYLAEDPEGVQYGYLPRPVAEALTWMPPLDPRRSPRRHLRAVSP
ncbi:hypothetical protein ACFVP0_27700 [Streptomyces cinereoruber]|uniref:hypothetical protein n=1 Tax=Streptomyces cinereoruber TaxID=67260 RepID=UPI0036A3A45B